MLENRLRLPGSAALSSPTRAGGFSLKYKEIGTMSFLPDLTDSEDEEMSAFDEDPAFGKTRVNAAKSAPCPPSPEFTT